MSESLPRGPRLEPDARRAQILACAERAFGERPYDAVSTTELAREAGVARGLINHYFGTKRGLYLEVVRRMVIMPPFVTESLPAGSLKERVEAALDQVLDLIAPHGRMWLAAIGGGLDPDVERILAEADDVAADRVLAATGLADMTEHRAELRAMIRAYGGLTKAAIREWLQRGDLSRDQVHLLLTRTLLTILEDLFPLVHHAEG